MITTIFEKNKLNCIVCDIVYILHVHILKKNIENLIFCVLYCMLPACRVYAGLIEVRKSRFFVHKGTLLLLLFLYSNEKTLKTMERKYQIRQRWSIFSPVFLSVKKRLNEKRKSELLLGMHCMASERCFLVELKRKYAVIVYLYSGVLC